MEMKLKGCHTNHPCSVLNLKTAARILHNPPPGLKSMKHFIYKQINQQ